MGVVLFEHNRKAYEAAMSLLEREGKAAVVHPTGTGKSFIAFHLCEEHPEAVVCWLSPSEYIFKTQRENWESAGGSLPENIRFYTYAKLLCMSGAEILNIKPDYIVLDEFHRCGARRWGVGVKFLLESFPQVPVLGLSATSIRYLDNQRDMSEEIFEGNVASELTLGEAIVRGILNPPRYVLSVFSYQNSLKRYKKRIEHADNPKVQEEAQAYFEELRRALEQAEGMETLFQKHMPDYHGKYLVFCADYRHMCEMEKQAHEWFAKVDKEPHIYSVYSEDAETDRAFKEFKEDESDHLKLLFCIDMLNEGIHLENISGVILLRPTVSPIIYKQQIGRVFSADRKKETVIFDIVLNIENLYSIGTVEEEMESAIFYYRSQGREDEIVHEKFHISGEVKDCVRLFRRLNETLSASWQFMYEAAERYYLAHGNLDIPKRYQTEEGLPLGQWLNTQRRVAHGTSGGTLTEEQKEKLNKIGMRWEYVKDLAWENCFAAAKAYYEEHGNLLVKVNGGSYHGVMLGKWIGQLRQSRKSGPGNGYLTEEKIQALDSIGMVWDVREYQWEQNYRAAAEYYREHGNLNVPSGYVNENGVRLGAWLSEIRAVVQKKDSKRAELTNEQKEKLEAVGIVWETKYDTAWRKSYEAACRYREEYGDLDIPAAYVSKEGLRLGKWIRRQRELLGTKLSTERQEKLEAIGMAWK